MERKWFIDIIIAIVIGLVATSCQTYSLKSGDLLFHVVSQGNAITDVTPGMIDHVAIVMSPDSVIEAVGKGVKTTPIDSLRQQDGHYLVGRVKGIDSKQSIVTFLFSIALLMIDSFKKPSNIFGKSVKTSIFIF